MDWKKARMHLKEPGIAEILLQRNAQLLREFQNWQKKRGKFPPVSLVGFMEYMVDHIVIRDYYPEILKRRLKPRQAPIDGELFRIQSIPAVFFKSPTRSSPELWMNMVNPHFRINFKTALDVVHDQRGDVIVTKLVHFQVLEGGLLGDLKVWLDIYIIPRDIHLIA